MSEWLPIESAPKDGTNIQLWWSAEFHAPVTGHWERGKWSDCNGVGWKVSGWGDVITRSSPTHWKPLPDPPKCDPAT